MSRRPFLATVGTAFLIVALALSACTSSGDEPRAGEDERRPLQAVPDVEGALERWRPWFEALLGDSGVPGASYAVVHDDRVIESGGFGVRELGTDDAVDADTVFQLASVSKPLGSTVVARLVGEGVIDWDDPIVEYAPEFALSDPWVTQHVTFADLYSHRSGLPEHIGDQLEDLGASRQTVFEQLRVVPLAPFRASYAYTNFGMTVAGVTAARAAGMSWEDASRQLLYEPLGMTHTSSTFADYIAASNRALPHQRVNGTWVRASQQRQPDAQSPAGGASSTANDLAQWLRLQLAMGSYDGQPLVDETALQATHTAHIVSGVARSADHLAPTYGLGWNVNADPSGELRLSHSGAFALGAATAVEVSIGSDVAIVVLTNGSPIGVAEAATKTFMDFALYGEQTTDWVSVMTNALAPMVDPVPDVDYSTPPAGATPASPYTELVGTYANAFFGDLVVRDNGAGLELVLGPDAMTFPLTHYDGDVFAFTLPGENAGPLTAVRFTVSNGRATSVELDGYATSKVNTFVRV